MNEFIFQRIIPRLDCMAAQINKLEQHQKQLPQIEISIESTNCDELISQMQKIYQNFSGGCNLKISVSLKEVAE